MSKGAFAVTWNEDSSSTVLGRITAKDGTGSATGKAGEGNWVKQSDLVSITCKVFDLDSEDPDTPISEPAVVIADSILDTPDTSNALWTKDSVGYNFQHDLGPSNFPTGGHRYLVEYKVTTTGGVVFHAAYRGPAVPIRSS